MSRYYCCALLSLFLCCYKSENPVRTSSDSGEDVLQSSNVEAGVKDVGTQLNDAMNQADSFRDDMDSGGAFDGMSTDTGNLTMMPDVGRLSECGNNIIETGEACDDGNREDNDFCSSDCLTSLACSSGVLKGEVVIKTPADIEQFAQAIRTQNCPVVDGDLIIIESELFDLDGLEELQHVTGNLKIGRCFITRGLPGVGGLAPWLNCYGNRELVSIEGLQNLSSVGGTMKIEDNTVLTSLSGLESLTSIGLDLVIRGNGSLSSLEGLSGLTSVGGYLGIGDCYETDLKELENLERQFEGYSSNLCEGNAALKSLEGLDQLESTKNLAIGFNESLTRLDGIQGIDSLELLKIAANPMLIDLSGLDNLAHIENVLYISGNSSLSSLAGLDSLETVGLSLVIRQNESLSTCQATALVGDLVDFMGEASICENLSDECEAESCL